MRQPLFRSVFLLGCLASSVGACAPEPEYDTVIAGGRVVDPESGLDGVRHLGINGQTIEVVSEEPLRGRKVIEARDLVVSAGFIDLHAHGQDRENSRYQVMDGVTSALECEIGVGDIERFMKRRQGDSHNHFGATIGHVPVRIEVMADPGTFLPQGAAKDRPATPEEIEAMRGLIEQGLERGAVGVGFGIQYTQGASRWEIIEMFKAAARHGAPCFVHIRHFGPHEPSSAVAALEEVLAASAVTGAGLHVVHANSSGGSAAPRLLEMIAGARGNGLDVTTECYPYTAGMTAIESGVFDSNWQEAFEMDYEDLQWVQTGERLTEESYRRYREQGGMVILHQNPEALVDEVVKSPLTLIASDGGLEKGKGHPRSAGTYSRILGRYVRDKGLLTLDEALRKVSLMPAQRLEGRVPAMRRKGRIRPGADADLAIFDLNQILDRSTYQEPAVFSEGMRYVLVAGTLVVNEGALVPDTFPGQPILGSQLEN